MPAATRIPVLSAPPCPLKKAPKYYLDLPDPPVLDLAERLHIFCPQGLNRTFFCNSGSEANETAFLLARIATGKRRILSLRRGLHGRTYLGMSATGIDFWRADPHLDPAFVQIPSPFDDRLHRTTPEAEKASLPPWPRRSEIGRRCGMIVEPIQGNGGIIPLSPAFLRGIREATRNASALLIADEVQTGPWRTGGWFGVTESGIVPDLMTLAKALGNGVPIAAEAADGGGIRLLHPAVGLDFLGGQSPYPAPPHWPSWIICGKRSFPVAPPGWAPGWAPALRTFPAAGPASWAFGGGASCGGSISSMRGGTRIPRERIGFWKKRKTEASWSARTDPSATSWRFSPPW